jgi:hypothetical protein
MFFKFSAFTNSKIIYKFHMISFFCLLHLNVTIITAPALKQFNKKKMEDIIESHNLYQYKNYLSNKKNNCLLNLRLGNRIAKYYEGSHF